MGYLQIWDWSWHNRTCLSKCREVLSPCLQDSTSILFSLLFSLVWYCWDQCTLWTFRSCSLSRVPWPTLVLLSKTEATSPRCNHSFQFVLDESISKAQKVLIVPVGREGGRCLLPRKLIYLLISVYTNVSRHPVEGLVPVLPHHPQLDDRRTQHLDGCLTIRQNDHTLSSIFSLQICSYTLCQWCEFLPEICGGTSLLPSSI